MTTNGMITLTTTNNAADQINAFHLGRLPGESTVLTGIVSGKFTLANDKLPAPMTLTLKPGCKVMFTRNSANWVNGTIGEVVDVDYYLVRVKIPQKDGETVVDVGQARWEAFTYKYNKVQGQIIPKVIGTYSQFPLTLAWGVTVHKAQSKTLEKVKVDLGDGAFACGQVYVALSRCRSLEDIILVRPIKAEDIKIDPAVKEFYARMVTQEQKLNQKESKSSNKEN